MNLNIAAILWSLAASAALSDPPSAPAVTPTPARVVSMNVCTDQLAMLLAAPGQLVSVSQLARDPQSSSMAEQALAYPVNRGQAEQIFLLHPDLVLAGSYTALATVQLLRDLGIPVVQLEPARALGDVPDQIRRVAAALGREAAGAALVAEYAAGLDALTSQMAPATAALYYPNGFTTGQGTLGDDLLRHAGFRNIGAEAGLTGGGILPLERLVLAAPQVIVTSARYAGASRSEEILTHPALIALRGQSAVLAASDADWICGTPFVLRALAQMGAARAALDAAPTGSTNGEAAP